MSFGNPFSAKTDGNTTVTATEINTAGARIAGSFDVAGTNTISGANTYSATQTFTGGVVRSGGSATTAWRRTTGSDSNVEIDESYDEYIVPTLTTGRTWTLDTTSAPSAAGIRIRISRWSLGAPDANQLTIQTEAGPSTIATMPGSQKSWVEVEWTGAAWVVSAWGGNASV